MGKLYADETVCAYCLNVYDNGNFLDYVTEDNEKDILERTNKLLVELSKVLAKIDVLQLLVTQGIKKHIKNQDQNLL